MATAQDVRRLALALPRAYEACVPKRVAEAYLRGDQPPS